MMNERQLLSSRTNTMTQHRCRTRKQAMHSCTKSQPQKVVVECRISEYAYNTWRTTCSVFRADTDTISKDFIVVHVMYVCMSGAMLLMYIRIRNAVMCPLQLQLQRLASAFCMTAWLHAAYNRWQIWWWTQNTETERLNSWTVCSWGLRSWGSNSYI